MQKKKSQHALHVKITPPLLYIFSTLHVVAIQYFTINFSELKILFVAYTFLWVLMMIIRKHKTLELYGKKLQIVFVSSLNKMNISPSPFTRPVIIGRHRFCQQALWERCPKLPGEWGGNSGHGVVTTWPNRALCTMALLPSRAQGGRDVPSQGLFVFFTCPTWPFGEGSQNNSPSAPS